MQASSCCMNRRIAHQVYIENSTDAVRPHTVPSTICVVKWTRELKNWKQISSRSSQKPAVEHLQVLKKKYRKKTIQIFIKQNIQTLIYRVGKGSSSTALALFSVEIAEEEKSIDDDDKMLIWDTVDTHPRKVTAMCYTVYTHVNQPL